MVEKGPYGLFFRLYLARGLATSPRAVRAGGDTRAIRDRLAQILPRLSLTASERKRAIAILTRNLESYDDLIVTNMTLEALAEFAQEDSVLRREVVPIIRGHLTSERKSLASRARTLLTRLT